MASNGSSAQAAGSDGTFGGQLTICSHPVINHKMTQLRRKETSSKHFRELLKEVTQYLGYAATQDLETAPLQVETPVATFKGCELTSQIAIVPILRSGLGMVDAMLDILPTAPVYHIGMYREKSSLLPVQYYNKLPRTCEAKRTLVLEPLIATAGTINAVLEILMEEWGCPEVTIISAVASRQGLKQLFEQHPKVRVFCAAIDEGLTDSGVILPGLGDSGERLNNSQPKSTLEPPTPKRLKLK